MVFTQPLALNRDHDQKKVGKIGKYCILRDPSVDAILSENGEEHYDSSYTAYYSHPALFRRREEVKTNETGL